MLSLSIKKLIQTNSAILVDRFSTTCSLTRKKKYEKSPAKESSSFSFPLRISPNRRAMLQNYEYFLVLDFEATCDQEKPPKPQFIKTNLFYLFFSSLFFSIFF